MKAPDYLAIAGIGQTELMHQARRLHESGCNLFQRARYSLCRVSKRVELFLIKKVRPERNTDRAFGVKQPVSAHRAVQLLENRRG